MAEYVLSVVAEADIDAILKASDAAHGREARLRYQALIEAALRRIAAEPRSRFALDRRGVRPGISSYHLRHSRDASRTTRVRDPAHVIFYSVPANGPVRIVRVLHERMEAARHLGSGRGEPGA